jgi:hypothetical protein
LGKCGSEKENKFGKEVFGVLGISPTLRNQARGVFYTCQGSRY